MSNPLDHALVPVVRGKIRSGGQDLIPGEIVKAFWSWPKYIQDLHLKQDNVVLITAAEAKKSTARAAEIRGANTLKEEKAEVKGLQAQIDGVTELVTALDSKREELLAQAEDLQTQLGGQTVKVAEKIADPGQRPEDDESEAIAAKPADPIEAATGLKLNEGEPEEEPDEDAVEEDDPDDDADTPLLDESQVGQISAWADDLTYRELQGHAKQLGVKGVGVKRDVLVDLVVEAAVAKEAERQAEQDADQAES